jgi:lactoylglutathione lyase
MSTFTWAHTNITVFDIDRSLAFYKEALGLSVTGGIDGPDGNFKIIYLGDGKNRHKLELTWLKDRTEPYNLGDNEIHMAMTTPDFDQALAKHKAMGCPIWENTEMGIYFIQDPDGYWTEIIPEDILQQG